MSGERQELRPGLPPVPRYMSGLPVHRGYPVPWFVAVVDGVPDFRIADAAKVPRAVRHGLCWMCGQRLGIFGAFIVGPVGAINRTSAEPPSHRACADFAARVCPFLTLPRAQRRGAQLPEGATETGGLMLKRNPGVVLGWVSRSFKVLPLSNGVIFTMGEPDSWQWYAEGREATRDEARSALAGAREQLEALADTPQLRAELDALCAAAARFAP